MPVFKSNYINRQLHSDNQQLSLGWYFPTHNLQLDRWSQTILAVKDHDQDAIIYVSGILRKILAEDNPAVILTVPSSTACPSNKTA